MQKFFAEKEKKERLNEHGGGGGERERERERLNWRHSQDYPAPSVWLQKNTDTHTNS